MNLPLLTTEDLKGDDLKTRFYTGFVNFGTFMVIFNSLSLITGKLNYWNGKDSLKDVRAQKFPRTDFFKTLIAGRK